jgi:hypothetical protein
MRRVITLSKAIGLMVPLAVGLCGFGCVNLDKPGEVAACASTNTCFNGDKKDAAVPKGDDASDSDDTRDSSAPPTDARIGDDSVPTDDAISADRADAGSADSTEVGADAATNLPDAGTADSRVGDDTAPDVAPSPDTLFADAPKDALGPDTADAAVVADTRPLPMDTGPNNVVTFNLGKGVGAMTGYGWAALGPADSISSPTCVADTPITSAAPCLSQTNWGTTYPGYPNALCVSASIPTTNPSVNWGIQVGVNANDPNTAGIGQPFKTVAVSASGAPTGDVRIELHRSGDPDATTYCAHWTNSATAVPLISFNTNCWDTTGTTGTKLTAADIPTIDKVGFQVAPGSTTITLTNLCVHSITFGN